MLLTKQYNINCTIIDLNIYFIQIRKRVGFTSSLFDPDLLFSVELWVM